MSRLATPVPRRRRLRAPAAPVPMSPTHTGFEPYGYHGVGETPGPVQTVAEKLAPGPAATKAAAHTPPPSHSGGTSGDLTVPGYEPATPTVPYVPSEPGHSAQDFARAFAAKRRRELLGTLTPLPAPGSAVGSTPIDRLAQTVGAAAADPLQTLLHAAGAVAPAVAAVTKPDRLLEQIAPVKNELPTIPHYNISAELAATRRPAASRAPAGSVASSLIAATRLQGYEDDPKGIGPGDIQPNAARAVGVAPESLRTPAGVQEFADRYLHQAGWRKGNRASQLKALTTYYGDPHQARFVYAQIEARNKEAAQAAKAGRADPLGPKTLGDVTLAQLRQAAKAGTLQVKGGVLSTPQNRQVLQQLLAAHQHVQATNGLTGPLTPSQVRFANLVSKDLGGVIKPRTIAVQALQEQSGQHAINRENEGNFNALDIGYTDSGPIALTNQPDWGNVKDAARATAEFFKGERFNPGAHIPEILERSKGKSVAEQLQIIGESGWATSSYAHDLANTAKLVGEKQDPEAIAQLVAAKHAAVKAGINPTPWNGDVQGGGSDYVWVRADAKGAIDWARSTLGTHEGSPRQRHWAELEALGPSEPWCADWVAVNLARRGVELPAGPNGSWNYEDPGWRGGTQIGTDIAKAKPGDLIVYGGGAHIAMYVGGGKVIAGNWGDEVAEYGATEDTRGISAIVRPHYKGGKVKVHAGQLPGSSSESTFGGEGAGAEAVGGTGGEEAAPGEAVPVSAGAQQGGGAAALANFAVPVAPSFAAHVAVPEINGEQTAAQELLALLTRPATTLNRA